MFVNSYPCVPACLTCTQTGQCSRQFDMPANESVRTRRNPWIDRGPNSLPLVPLSCGCRGIPWPARSLLHNKNPEVLCDRHGWVKVIDPPKPKKTADVSPDQLVIDIPPF